MFGVFFPTIFFSCIASTESGCPYIVWTMNKSQLEFQVLYFHIGKSISGWGTHSNKVFHSIFWVGRNSQRSSSPLDDLYMRKEVVLFQSMKNFYFWRNPPGQCVMGFFLMLNVVVPSLSSSVLPFDSNLHELFASFDCSISDVPPKLAILMVE